MTRNPGEGSGSEPGPHSDATIGPDGSLLHRLDSELTWPAWESRNRLHPASASPGVGRKRDIGAARARLVTDGGAYVSIMDPVPDSRANPGVGEVEGLLGGFSFAVKDIVAVAGQPLRAGSAVRSGAAPETRDAPIVSELRRVGAILVGTTALHEFAFGVTGINRSTGTPANPHDARRIPGGSSSGSAVAVAEGSARIAVGTDTGGSIRIPAALCGVVGFKPRYGSYPTEDVFPLAPSLDHLGIFARSVDDVRAVHAALGHRAPGAQAPAVIGVSAAELEVCDALVRERVESALDILARDGGCRIEPVEWPDPEGTFSVSTAIMFSEAAAVHRENLGRRPELYGADVLRRLRTGLAIPATAYVSALRHRRGLSAGVRDVLSRIAVFAGPTVPMPAPTVSEAGDPSVAARLVANTRLSNLTGLPTLSLPLPGEGLPVGLQLTALDEATLLSHAAFVDALLADRS